MKPYAAVEGGVRLAVRVIPRASRTALDGIVQDADGKPLLKLRLKAPPVEGAANAALIAFLAEELGLRKADITLRSGETGRTKLLILSGDSAGLRKRLDALLG
jgi:uncharacterized protein (TIGR00251 family)